MTGVRLAARALPHPVGWQIAAIAAGAIILAFAYMARRRRK